MTHMKTFEENTTILNRKLDLLAQVLRSNPQIGETWFILYEGRLKKSKIIGLTEHVVSAVEITSKFGIQTLGEENHYLRHEIHFMEQTTGI